MSSIWTFVRKPSNQRLLSWLGGGGAIAAGGIWAVVTYLMPAHETQGLNVSNRGQDRRQRLRLDGQQHGIGRHGDGRAMPRDDKKVISGFCAAAAFFAATVAVSFSPWSAKAAGESSAATESVVIGGSVSNSTVINTVNHENPATLALLAKALS